MADTYHIIGETEVHCSTIVLSKRLQYYYSIISPN